MAGILMQAEKSALQSSERLRLALDASSACIWDYDTRGGHFLGYRGFSRDVTDRVVEAPLSGSWCRRWLPPRNCEQV